MGFETNTANSKSPAASDATSSHERRFNKLPQVAQLSCFALLGMILLSTFQSLLQDPSEELRHLDHYGHMVTDQLTRLSKDAMVREDVIALNVLAEQVASDPAINSIGIYSLDGTVLASYGPTDGSPGGSIDTSALNTGPDNRHQFSRPIQLVDATAGFVRVTVNPDALKPESGGLFTTSQYKTIASWFLSGLVLWGLGGWLTRHNSAALEAENLHTPARDVYLLVMRLFNSDGMGSGRRDASMASSLEHIADVAEIYSAEFAKIQTGAVAIAFDSKDRDSKDRDSKDRDSTDSEDPAFEAACMALAIARLCNQPGGGRYRYSLQRLSLGDYAPLKTQLEKPGLQDALADSLLLAALASDNTIVLTSEYAQTLTGSERLELTREHSPALSSLQTSDADDYYLLSGANPTTQAKLDQQLSAIRQGLFHS